MLSYSGMCSTVHLAFFDDPFLSWFVDSSSSSAWRYLSWWLLSRTAFARWKSSIDEMVKLLLLLLVEVFCKELIKFNG